MTQLADTHIKDYFSWLKKDTVITPMNDMWSRISTPFYDRHNDNLAFYYRVDGNGYYFSDDGYILDDLAMCGCAIESESRIKLLNQTLAGFGISRDKNALVCFVPKDEFAAKMHCFIQAMLAVNDLFYTSQTYVKNIFQDDVQNWFELHNISYIAGASFTGLSGYSHRYEFIIPHSRNAPERFIKVLNQVKRDKALSIVAGWNDIQSTRKEGTKLYIIINDQENQPSAQAIHCFESYKILPLPWSNLEDNAKLLTA